MTAERWTPNIATLRGAERRSSYGEPECFLAAGRAEVELP
jgi:hypothetical protein